MSVERAAASPTAISASPTAVMASPTAIAASPTPIAAAPSATPFVAILCALAAFLLFTGMDTTVKIVAERTGPIQAGFFNALFALLPMALAIMRRGRHALYTRRWRLHALRGLFSVVGLSLTFYAYSQMPLADAYAILFIMPLVITALSVPILGEQVGWRRWTAILVGFLGVLIMLRPGSGLAGPAALAALAGCTASALGILTLRLLQRTDATEGCVLYGNLAVLFGFGLVMPFVMVTPTALELALSALGGCLAGAAFLLMAEAYRRAPAAVVAPFQYSQMPYGVVSGYVLAGTLPDPWMLVGAAIVIGSGVYILRREAWLKKR